MADEFDKAIKRKTENMGSLKFQKVEPGAPRKRHRFTGGEEDLSPVTDRASKMREEAQRYADMMAGETVDEDLDSELHPFGDPKQFKDEDAQLPERHVKLIKSIDDIDPDQMEMPAMEVVKNSDADREMAAMKQIVDQKFPQLSKRLANPDYELTPQESSQIKAQVLGNMNSPQKKRDAVILDLLLNSDSWIK